MYFTTPSGVSQVTAGGAPSVFVAQTGDGAGNHLNQPLGITSDAAGNLYVSNVNNGDIVKIAPDATTSVFSHTDTTSWLYAGLAIDKSGNLYAAERNSGKVAKIAPDGTVSTVATGLFRPDTLAIDSVGDVYSSNEDNTISKITPAGSVSTFGAGISGGLAVDRNDVLYVSTGHEVKRIAPDGTLSTFLSGLQSPGSLAFGSDGLLYVPDYGTDTLLTADPSGNVSSFSQFASNGGDLTVVRTPEPGPAGAISLLVAVLLYRRGRR